MHAADHLQLQSNPFTASTSGARIGRPLQAALGEVIRQIGLEAPVVVVCGNAGTGKTLLMNMIARACTDMGLCARQIVRGDLMHVAVGQCSDVLLIDEADSITDSTLHALVSQGANSSATTMIFLCLPSNVRRFTSSGGRAVIIELAPLTRSDARNYLLERATSAGRPDLFEVEALDLLIDGSRGSPRVLRSIASLAFFAAAVDGSPRIGPKHVADSLASQIYFEAPKSDQTTIPTTPHGEVPIPAPMIAGPIKASTPAPVLAESASDLVPFGSVAAEARKKFGAARPRSVVWIPRLIGITVALAASVAIAVGLPSLLIKSIPGNANASNSPPAEARAVPRLGFASFVPGRPAVSPREAPIRADASRQNTDIAKALKEGAGSESKPVAVTAPAPKETADQVLAAKKPAGKDMSGIVDQTKAAMEEAHLKNALAAKEAAAPPAPLQELADPAPAPKDVVTIMEPPKQEEAPQVPAPQVLAVLPPAEKQRQEADRAKAEERALALGREAVLAKIAADRALAAKQAEERGLAARQAANRESMRELANSLRGIRR